MTTRRELLKGLTAASAGVAALSSNAFLAEAKTKAFDYIVVGSGPGGGPLACNLAKAGYSVCLMEAGGSPRDPDIRKLIEVPAFNADVTAAPKVAWEYFVRHYSDDEQQQKDSKYVAARGGVLYPRASAIGGCAIHNVLFMMYPSNSDWEHIADLTGDKSWSPDLMRTYFQRLEQCRYAAPHVGAADAAHHGFNGWQPTELPDPQIFYNDPQFRAMLHAAERVMGKPGDVNGFLHNKLDPNDYATTQNDQEGLYSLPMSRKNGVRWSIQDHILMTAAAYPNLTIMTNCLATRILMNGETATGVEYMQGTHLYRASPLADPMSPMPQTSEVHATREVIISAGAFNSPQILKLSGIGSAEELSKFGIPTRIELPGVGTGMMDRYEASVVTQLKDPLTVFDKCVPRSAADPCLVALQQGRGIYTTSGVALSGVRKSDPSRPDRDLVIFLAGGQFRGYYPGWQKDLFNPARLSWAVLKAHTQNRAGTVTLRSSDPRDAPQIDFHYFQEGSDQSGEDLASIVNAIQLIRRLNAEIPDYASSELAPGPTVQSAAEIATFVKNEAWGHHASCSNRMGASGDRMAVVDSEFKVFGTRNLRVVDASVFPRIPGYFITIPIFMISEKASDVILADARPRGGMHRLKRSTGAQNL